MAFPVAQVAVHVAKSLYDKITQETKNTEDSTEFMRSIKFDRYNETSLCKSLQGIQMAYFDTFVNNFGKRYDFPQHITESILEGKHCKVNEVVFKEFKFAVGKSNQVSYLGSVTRRRGGRGGGIDFACVIVDLKFKFSKEEVASVKANAFLKFFGICSDTTEMKDRNLTQEEQDRFADYLRNKATLALQSETSSSGH